jgi:hypothetical protein
MLRQTAESPDRHRVLHPGDRNTPVELGTFRDLVFEHNLENEIEFAVAWKLPESIVVRDPLTRETLTGNQIRFEAKIASDPKGAQQQIKRFEYVLANGSPCLKVEMTPLESSGPPSMSSKLSPTHWFVTKVAPGSFHHRSVSMLFQMRSEPITKTLFLPVILLWN